MAIENILFDADGVIQYPTTLWQPGLQAALNLENDSEARAFLEAVLEAEANVLEFDAGFVEQLQIVLERWQRPGFMDETLAVLHSIEVYCDVMQTIQAVRRTGIPCHIGSNQQSLRARHMSEGLNYRSLFDREFYSCFVGSAKPDVGFFEKVVAQLGCHPGAVLFLDDRAENVAAAKAVGLNALQFFGKDGAVSLKKHLASFGVFVKD